MKQAFIIFLVVCAYLPGSSQKTNAEIFIPLNNRSEIWLKPKVDTLENLKKYEFKIRVAKEYKISQFLFEKGLAVHNDSVLVISPNSTKYGSIDTATLRVIVTSVSGSRIMLFQKQFLIHVPEKLFPVISNPQTNLMKLNDKIWLERNKPYPKNIFTDAQPFMAMYDNNVSLNKLEVQSISLTLYEKEGKQFPSNGDTLSMAALHEIKKLKEPTPVYFKVDALSGKTKKVVWNRVVIYPD
ncbi:MAG: hypothetical protein IPN22_04410 [Bacteroidetes bacterium]|nr:hypothetical protein [Bacteroidota bacterium]